MSIRSSVALIALAAFGALALASSVRLAAADLQPLHDSCSISRADQPGRIRLRTGTSKCGSEDQCGSNFSSESLSRFTGFTVDDLSRDGAHLTATLATEAGTFTCSGTVSGGTLSGNSVFTPDAAFVARMGQLGFHGFDSEKLMAYVFIGVDSAFAQRLQQTGVQGITIDNLIALRIFNVDPEYIHSLAALGYEQLDADKLIGLRVQKVDAEEVREFRALGYKPTADELIQIRIFDITPDFIKRMQARGFHDLTISKLVQIRIFKLAD
jgi:hypothetical protein